MRAYSLVVYGIVGVTVVLILVVMGPPIGELMSLGALLALTATLAIVVGFVAHRFGLWERFRTVRHALTSGYVIAAVITLACVIITARLMFVNAHDLALAVLLLFFAGATSVAFGSFASGSVAQRVHRLAEAADRIKEGDLSVRVPASGDDEIARLANTFNTMAARLEESAREAEAVNTARQHLIAGASHDLRTPLASLRAMLDAMADGIVTDEATRTDYVARSQAEIARMSRLIDDLMELARLEAGELDLQIEPASLSDLISDALASFRARAQAAGVALSGEVGPDVDPVLMASHPVGRVLANLLDNALRHTPQGGTIRVTARCRGGEALVRVADTGQGIAADDLPFVLETFYRGDKSRSREGGGSGLGLAITRRLVEAHGGTITVESTLGEGTTVAFTLPRA
ncbi:MAG: HAMP domain-containing histidine kinase [Chloroflexi bacterium]|nr:HAMP domain-containing histidine kinase [Chloroflexota bacterium]